jgi:hypothetical protein
MTLRNLLWVLGVSLVSGCGTEPCGSPGEFGVVVELRDEAGEPAADGTTVIARQGDFTETLGQLDELSVAGLVDRSGTYDLTITKPGYLTVERADIEVPDACGGDPVVIEVELHVE